MNLIGNCCISNHVAELCGEGHTNPFTWVDLDFESMFHLITHWDTINWGKIRIEEHPHPYGWAKNAYWLIVDDKVKIRYVHYLFDPMVNTPSVKGADVRYNKIWKYIVDKYVERTRRMLELHDNPTFIIEWGHMDYKGDNWKRLVKCNPKYNVVVITRGHSLSELPSNILVIHDPNNTEFPLYFARKYYKQIYSWCTPGFTRHNATGS